MVWILFFMKKSKCSELQSTDWQETSANIFRIKPHDSGLIRLSRPQTCHHHAFTDGRKTLLKPVALTEARMPVVSSQCSNKIYNHMMLCQIIAAAAAAGKSSVSCRHWHRRDSNQTVNKIYVSGLLTIKAQNTTFISTIAGNFPKCIFIRGS